MYARVCIWMHILEFKEYSMAVWEVRYFHLGVLRSFLPLLLPTPIHSNLLTRKKNLEEKEIKIPSHSRTYFSHISQPTQPSIHASFLNSSVYVCIVAFRYSKFVDHRFVWLGLLSKIILAKWLLSLVDGKLFFGSYSSLWIRYGGWPR